MVRASGAGTTWELVKHQCLQEARCHAWSSMVKPRDGERQRSPIKYRKTLPHKAEWLRTLTSLLFLVRVQFGEPRSSSAVCVHSDTTMIF